MIFCNVVVFIYTVPVSNFADIRWRKQVIGHGALLLTEVTVTNHNNDIFG